jgi:tetratricopeptide (TPR) repeat protein
MRANVAQWIRVSKRLTQAGGYLELGMPQQALDCLDNLGVLGPFEAQVELLRGEAYRRQRRFQEAATSFKMAAEKSSSPRQRETFLAMSICYGQTGNMQEAFEMLARARGAPSPEAE